MKPELEQKLKRFENLFYCLYGFFALICLVLTISQTLRGERLDKTWIIAMSASLGFTTLLLIIFGAVLKQFHRPFLWALNFIGSSLYILGFVAGDYNIYFAGTATLLVFGAGSITFLPTLRAAFAQLKRDYHQIRKETEEHQASITSADS